MWLDEALTVNIAKLPLAKLPDALRHDGAPPLYYGLLHVWMRAFGTSDLAARSLSSVLALASLPLVWLVGRRLAGPRAASLTLLLVAVSPFAVRYATEARMYTLVIFLVLLGILAFERALDDLRRPGPLVAVAVLAGLLVLTHYWALFLTVAAASAMLARRAWTIVIAIAVGTVVFFLPWTPVFLYQSQHTGTPWAAAPGLREVFSAIVNFAGGNNDAGVFLGLLFLAIALVAVYGRPGHSGTIELAWPGDRAATPLASVTFGALFVGVAASVVVRSGFAPRYASVVLAPFLVVVALGLTKLPSLRTQIVATSACIVLSLVGAVHVATMQRTQARVVAAALRTHAQPGDLVVDCPDQLGPSLNRELGNTLTQITYPNVGPVDRIDWVDYAKRNKAADPGRFARDVLARADGHRIFLVWAPSYRTFGDDCHTLLVDLRAARGTGTYLVHRKPKRYYEGMNLVALPAKP
jgi:uncharacterized membrane protein